MTTPATRPQNVVLTGFMGTGKTTVGRLLAGLLGWKFVDTDLVIEERHGPIPALFENISETGFRALECQVAEEVARRSEVVVATGGAMVVDPQNAAALTATGRVYCLVAEPDVILSRLTLGDTPERPLLGSSDRKAQIVKLLSQRSKAYSAFQQIRTDGRTPQEVANEIHRLHTR